MKNKLKELNVDIIGGQGPLTKDEEKAISEFIRANKQKNKQHEIRKAKKAVKQPA